MSEEIGEFGFVLIASVFFWFSILRVRDSERDASSHHIPVGQRRWIVISRTSAEIEVYDHRSAELLESLYNFQAQMVTSGFCVIRSY